MNTWPEGAPCPGQPDPTSSRVWNPAPWTCSSHSGFITSYVVKFLFLKLDFLICQIGVTIISTSQMVVRNKQNSSCQKFTTVPGHNKCRLRSLHSSCSGWATPAGRRGLCVVAMCFVPPFLSCPPSSPTTLQAPP